MERKKFLQSLGLIGVAAVIPKSGLGELKDLMDEPSNDDLLKDGTSCTLVPEETVGPYPAPSSISTNTLIRSDVRESQTGITLDLSINILNLDNECAAVPGLRVDIWQCNIRGYYSAYSESGIDGTQNYTGATWLRGIQYTDSNGQVNFTTVYPGWYTGRATHIHVQIFDSANNLLRTTQIAFPDEINTTVNNYYATSGTNPLTNATDDIFADSYTQELATVSGSTSAGYSATIDMAIHAGTLGVDTVEAETGGQFSKFTCYPSPFESDITISFNLLQQSDVAIQVTDLSGRIIDEKKYANLSAGANNITFEIDSNIPAGIYLFNLTISNLSGTFSQVKKAVKQQ